MAVKEWIGQWRKTVAFSISLSLPVAFQSFVFDRQSKVQPRLEGSTSSWFVITLGMAVFPVWGELFIGYSSPDWQCKFSLASFLRPRWSLILLLLLSWWVWSGINMDVAVSVSSLCPMWSTWSASPSVAFTDLWNFKTTPKQIKEMILYMCRNCCGYLILHVPFISQSD